MDRIAYIVNAILAFVIIQVGGIVFATSINASTPIQAAFLTVGALMIIFGIWLVMASKTHGPVTAMLCMVVLVAALSMVIQEFNWIAMGFVAVAFIGTIIGVWCMTGEAIKKWIAANQMDEVPAVHLGYNPLPSRKEDLEVLLANKQEELAEALARGLVYKARMEARVAWMKKIHQAEVDELFFKVQDLSEKLDKKHDQLMVSEYDLDRARAALRRTADERDNLEKQLAVYRLINWADKTHATIIK